MVARQVEAYSRLTRLLRERGWTVVDLARRLEEQGAHVDRKTLYRLAGRAPTFVDHIVPRALAPELVNDLDNVALACRPCNLHKADRTHAIDPETGDGVRLFHTRIDRMTLKM